MYMIALGRTTISTMFGYSYKKINIKTHIATTTLCIATIATATSSAATTI